MSVPTQDVLIVHPNEGRRAALAEVLGVHRVVAVESQMEATRRMEVSAPTLIIAPPDNARRFLRHVDRAAPEAVRVFVCAQSDRQGLEELVETAAEGHVFSTLDDSLTVSELGRRISNILQLRASARVMLSARMEAEFRLQGRAYASRCLDVGNFGAALQVPLDAAVAAFLPGAVLEDLRVEREGRRVLQVRRALVRHVQPVRLGAEHSLRVGISWGNAQEDGSGVPLTVVRDPVAVLAMLRKAVRRGSGVWLTYPDSPSEQFVLDAPVLDQLSGRSVLRGDLADCGAVSAGDVLNLSFEVGGQSYSGVTSVLRVGPGMTLSVPRTLGMKNRRGLQRFRPGQDHRFLVSFTAPFSGKSVTRSVLDLSTRGLSFSFDASYEVLPAGSLLDVSLLLPDGTEAACRAEVRSVDGVSPDGGPENPLRPYRCGIRFLDVPPQVRNAVHAAFVAARSQTVEDGARSDFQAIWRMMEAAHYGFHPDYPFGREPTYMGALERMHQRLAASGELGSSLVYKDADGVQGHVAGLRIHSRSWLVQHLAVRPGFHRQDQIAHELSALAIELGEAHEDVDFIRFSWREDNRWPSRLGTWLLRVMDSRGLSWLRHFEYMRRELDSAPPPPEGLPPVDEASDADCERLEFFLRERGEVVRVLAEDLQVGRIRLEGLAERYAAHGLHRARQVFCVRSENGPVAMALQEEGSPGINLIEKTSAFWFVVLDPGHPGAAAAVRALIERCAEHARSKGRAAAVALAADEDVAALEAAGFQKLGRFSEWFFHRTMVRRWVELFRSIFERVQRVGSAAGSRGAASRRSA
ncbi:PilZ domain-containing protein [Myxococcus sp. K15C18031901]|uniref:PilZ domain-containing protein n=1 Tax=Myxococcus dinghuensis TaxID=2906761 RepID=UPI0020A7B533|nr:PilZ domain-containing protein [Myxococcus dinghuensis]MCP3103228.1 PilZ domain-containing protein [Myxococcus dinghuensis]